MQSLKQMWWVGSLALVTAAGCGAGGAPAKKAPPPREVEVLTLAPSEYRQTREYLGSLISRQTVSVVPQVSGYVRKILVKPGQKVEAGAPLLEVDQRQESAALDSAQAQKTSADSSEELARQTLARTEALYKEGLASAQELERARAQADAAKAASRAAAAQVSQRQVQLQYYSVRAPFAGSVGDVLAKVGDFVSANTPLTSIAQAEVLEVTVAVPADSARGIKPGTPLELLDKEGKVLVACPVFFVAPQADPRTQLVEVKGAFPNSVALRPNELIRTRVVYSVEQTLQLPALAVVRQSGQPFAFVVEEKNGQSTVGRKPVSLGALGESAYVVKDGLKPGDRIAVSSLQALRDGAAIKPKLIAGVSSPGQGGSGTSAR